MPKKSFGDPDMNAGVPASFGADVKRVRLARSLTQRHLATAAGYSEGYVSKVEAGLLVPHQRFAEGCDKAFGTGDLFAEQLRRVTEGEHPSWFAPFLKAEEAADRIEDYSTLFVYGMLQTPEYARATMEATNPGAEPRDIDAAVAGRMRRREIMKRNDPPQVWVVVHEACLRVTVGTPQIMAAQLHFLLDSLRRYPTLNLQVLPMAETATGSATPLTLLTSQGQQAVYMEGPRGGQSLGRGGKAISASRAMYDYLRASALGPHASLDVIESARSAHERDARMDQVHLQRRRGRKLHRVGPVGGVRRKRARPGR